MIRTNDRAQFLPDELGLDQAPTFALRASVDKPTFALGASVGKRQFWRGTPRGKTPRPPSLPHEQRPEPLLGLVQVVRRAAQFEIVERRLTTLGKRNAVVVLEACRLGATAFRPDERASIAVASADRASQMRSDIA